MVTLDWLEQHMQHSAELARWIHTQFPYEFADQPLADWQGEFSAGQRSRAWRSLIALEDGRLLGSASLALDDLAQRPDLGPWLACVFVRPECRGQGLAERLIEGICRDAAAQGHRLIYLHTRDRADYYGKRRWQTLETFEAWGETHSLMYRELLPI
ncbi:GNAT family N-acetyltransferase [Pseudomonas sp. RIT-PI-AD]|uniref:GNAT family N-acetyltransferase n=1 Tax=Pseudomonas sp. RIT-PI-AD TaxID=3035294 RepID=UPI0021DB7A99|nr:GNAT family N-acetyltransferase [Pseudomonas sp. RIT-PI-AD]